MRRLTVIAVLAVLLLTGCSAIRSTASRMVLGGEGEFATTVLCPLLSEKGNTVAALPRRGDDESLWHLIRIALSPVLGCAPGATEDLLVEPGVVPLTDKAVAKWVPGDRVTLTIADATNPRGPMSREAHRLFSQEVASASPSATVSRDSTTKRPLRVVVRANRRNSL